METAPANETRRGAATEVLVEGVGQAAGVIFDNLPTLTAGERIIFEPMTREEWDHRQAYDAIEPRWSGQDVDRFVDEIVRETVATGLYDDVVEEIRNKVRGIVKTIVAGPERS